MRRPFLPVFLYAVAVLLGVRDAAAQVTISNGIVGDGFFDVEVVAGGESRNGDIDPIGSGVRRDVIFDYFHYIDVGANGDGVRLAGTTITQMPTLTGPNEVTSAGTFAGQNGTIAWTAISQLLPGSDLYTTRLTFTSDEPFGTVRLIQYLDEDVGAVSDDELVVVGTSGQDDFQLLTVDGAERVGVAQGAFYSAAMGMSYIGFNADQYPELKLLIEDGGATYTIPGVIDTADLPPRSDSNFPNFPVFGLNDVTTAVAFDFDPDATSATVTLYLGGSADGGVVDISTEALTSPAHVKFNTYLQQQNIFEVTNAGSDPAQVNVALFNLRGEMMTAVDRSVSPLGQIDVDINNLVFTACQSNPSSCEGFVDNDGDQVVDTYGVVRLTFDDTNADIELSGRMAFYRINADRSSYSFAYARPLRNESSGTTYTIANTYDPQGMGFQVPNWVEIINLDDEPRTFVYTSYDINGIPAEVFSFVLQPLGELDIRVGDLVRDASGNIPEAVYLVEIAPESDNVEYLHYLSRYSSNGVVLGAGTGETYNYAFSIEGRDGIAGKQYVPISNENVDADCAEPLSIVEVANTSSQNVTLNIFYYNSEGIVVGAVLPQQGVLPPRGQFHYNPTPSLVNGTVGSAQIQASPANAPLIAQTVVYYYNCDGPTLQTAYVTPATGIGVTELAGTVNTFLGMRDTLRLIATTSAPVAGSVNITDYLGNIYGDTFTIDGDGTVDFGINDERFIFPPDTTGVLTVNTQNFRPVIGQVLRVRREFTNGRQRLDYIMDTRLR